MKGFHCSKSPILCGWWWRIELGLEERIVRCPRFWSLLFEPRCSGIYAGWTFCSIFGCLCRALVSSNFGCWLFRCRIGHVCARDWLNLNSAISVLSFEHANPGLKCQFSHLLQVQCSHIYCLFFILEYSLKLLQST